MSSNVRPATMERITTPALAESFIDQQLAELRQQIGDKKVLLALSGVVDSSVVAALLIKAIGKQLIWFWNTSMTCSGSPLRSRPWFT